MKTQITKPKDKIRTMSQILPAGDDIVDLILDDHKPLKELIEIMKNSEAKLSERKVAFQEFAPLLTAHAKSEEKVLYTFMKKKDDLKVEAHEGDVEHGLADQMVEEIKSTRNDDVYSAKVKVLAELVEHHIDEEEKELLPRFEENSKADDRLELGMKYSKLKEDLEATMGVPAKSAHKAAESHLQH